MPTRKKPICTIIGLSNFVSKSSATCKIVWIQFESADERKLKNPRVPRERWDDLTISVLNSFVNEINLFVPDLFSGKCYSVPVCIACIRDLLTHHHDIWTLLVWFCNSSYLSKYVKWSQIDSIKWYRTIEICPWNKSVFVAKKVDSTIRPTPSLHHPTRYLTSRITSL